MVKPLLVKVYQKGHRFLTKYNLNFYPIRSFNKILIRYLKSNYMEVEGHKMFLDSEDSMRLSTRGFFDSYVLEIAKQKIKPGDVVLDIGAHIGYYTLWFAKLVGPQGKVFAFEPDPGNFSLLTKNVEVNKYKNVVLVQKAVSNYSGKVKLYLAKDISTTHSLCQNKYTSNRWIEVESVRLDHWLPQQGNRQNKSINFIKIDVEGAELQALEGMSQLLKKNRKLTMVTEMVPSFLQGMNISPRRYVEVLEAVGFALYYIDEQNHKTEPLHLVKVLEAYRSKDNDHINLLCVKNNSNPAAL